MPGELAEQRERRIAKALGVTVSGLEVLRRLNRGDQISGNNTGPVLDRLGLTYRPTSSQSEPRRITDKGRELLALARSMGF